MDTNIVDVLEGVDAILAYCAEYLDTYSQELKRLDSEELRTLIDDLQEIGIVKDRAHSIRSQLDALTFK